MKTRSRAICLFAVTCALSAGCSAVYVKNGLGEEHRRDVPDLEGRWSGTDRNSGKSGTFDVIREGLGCYRVVHPETGDFVDAKTGDRTSVRVETFEVGGQPFVEPAVTTTGGDPRFPFPLLLKADLNGGGLRLAALRPEFLKANPAVVPHTTLGAAPGVEPDYLVTASPSQLASFLTLVSDNPAAWEVFGNDVFVKLPDPPGPIQRLWTKWSGLFWSLLFGVSLACLEAYRRSRAPAPVTIPAPGWVEDVVRLLILAARMPRQDPVLRDRERSLIRSVAAAEAKREDAPGGPTRLGPAEIDGLIRGHEGECRGVPALIGFLAEPGNATARIRLFKRVWQVAVCDGPATDGEVEFAKGFAAETGMTEAEFLAVSLRYYRPRPPEAALDEARTLLEVPRSATPEEVKRAYKRKAREYHPDAHAGVAENLKRLAAERFSKLGEAKETLLAALGRVPLVAKDPAGRLVPAEDLPATVRCFGCGTARPGAAAGEASLARCPKCLMLLYHEPGFAAELTGESREPAAAS